MRTCAMFVFIAVGIRLNGRIQRILCIGVLGRDLQTPLVPTVDASKNRAAQKTNKAETTNFMAVLWPLQVIVDSIIGGLYYWIVNQWFPATGDTCTLPFEIHRGYRRDCQRCIH
ncbi:hypothetical protein QBC32DRAFT_88830 [Pseudoneurospora amorphoporcata]|uniref:Uncharacterized protein n=1 Tax=Pseudoneurospora amorphoporcata TaxID=241081 RepID=A0AAN6P0F1_9PEZI|nr:hypothetical protein QBC32DRAFT_88830 [Pseudoneurospora amorphoporcata]